MKLPLGLTALDILEAEEWRQFVFIKLAREISKNPARRLAFLRFAAPEIKILETEAEMVREIARHKRGKVIK